MALLSAGCGLVPSDPADPPMFGARVEDETIVVKIPMCPTDEIRRVEVYDSGDAEHDDPRIAWSASEPTSEWARNGIVDPWSGEGFTKHSNPPAESAAPSDIGVSYTDPTNDGRDDVFDLRTISTGGCQAQARHPPVPQSARYPILDGKGIASKHKGWPKVLDSESAYVKLRHRLTPSLSVVVRDGWMPSGIQPSMQALPGADRCADVTTTGLTGF
ncbi:hypothetical protein [Streptomyces sp. NPDC050759]|uniref:hypothetical protein n=1 Tax=Streptomyces sp. NPDC050759 TaxID=3365635 RepID=UPI0037B9C1C1